MNTIRLWSLLIVSFLTISSRAQLFTLAVEQTGQTAYIGIENHISCTVEMYPCDSVILSANNGSLVKTGCNEYIYKPNNVADTRIAVLVKNANGTTTKIGEKEIRVRNIPLPTAVIGGFSEGKIPKNAMKAQVGVGCYLTNTGVEFKYSVVEFNFSIIRNGREIFSGTNNGNAFNTKISAGIQQILKDDIVSVTAIKVVGPTGRVDTIKPMELIVAD